MGRAQLNNNILAKKEKNKQYLVALIIILLTALSLPVSKICVLLPYGRAEETSRTTAKFTPEVDRVMAKP